MDAFVRTPARGAGVWAVVGLVASVVGAGCAGPQHVAAPDLQAQTLAELYEVRDTDLSCEQAERLAYQTVERMGYGVTEVTPVRPADGARVGTILAERRRGAQTARVRVGVECRARGVVVDAASLSSLDVASDDPHPLVTYHHVSEARRLTENRPPPTTYFRRAFYSLFHGLAANTKRYGPQGRLHVDIKPLPAIEEELRFGRRLSEVAVIAVEIANRTQQTYVLDTRHVRLLTTDGEHVSALPAGQVPSLAPPMVSQAVSAQVVTRGYLYYPAREYVGVDGYLTEVDSQRRHAFRLTF